MKHKNSASKSPYRQVIMLPAEKENNDDTWGDKQNGSFDGSPSKDENSESVEKPSFYSTVKLVKNKQKELKQDKHSPQKSLSKLQFNDDFLTFAEIDETKFKANEKEAEESLEAHMARKYDLLKYPWLTTNTLKIKDIFLFLHSEILDFAEYVSTSRAEKLERKQVVSRIK